VAYSTLRRINKNGSFGYLGEPLLTTCPKCGYPATVHENTAKGNLKLWCVNCDKWREATADILAIVVAIKNEAYPDAIDKTFGLHI
jgi:hypothetical protein